MTALYAQGVERPAAARRGRTPSSDIDLFADDSLDEPYDNYAALRALGGAVWLERHGLWGLPRYETVFQALRDHATFSSQANGVSMNPAPPGPMPPTLMADEPLHAKLRGIVAEQLMPASVRRLEERISEEAETLIARLVDRGRFEAMRDLARHLPLTIVTELVGVPADLGEQLLDYSAALGNAFGPADRPRTQAGFARLAGLAGMVAKVSDRANLRPGSMGRAIFAAADRGEIAPEHAPVLMRDYIGPSLDTTIAGTGNLLWQLATDPEAWNLLKGTPRLATAAIDEALRLESPIQFFTRTAVVDTELGGVRIAAGERVLLMYGSANRDERKWPEPDRMDIQRKGLSAQLAFGAGIHSCAGRGLARSEMLALLKAMVSRISRMELVSATRGLNSVFRGFEELNLAVE